MMEIAGALRPDGLRAVALSLSNAKTLPPPRRPGTISRPGLVNRLRASRTVPVVAIVAPAGYGKTTLLADWAERDGRACAWLTVDHADDDLGTFLSGIRSALGGAGVDVSRAVHGSQRAPAPVLASIATSLAAVGTPLVLMLDDVQLLTNPECFRALGALLDALPTGSQLVLASRSLLPLPVARLRVQGRIVELDSADLRLSDREARMLVQAAGANLSRSEVEALNRKTEGWAAGLYLTTLSARMGERVGAVRAPRSRRTGDLDAYFRKHLLPHLSAEERTFLRRSSVLPQMCGPLCDVTLDREGSSELLEAIERWNLFLVPLDRERRWYRFHNLFREMLARELEQKEPRAQIRALHRRAAGWFEAQGDIESAVEHLDRARETGQVLELVERNAHVLFSRGRTAVVERWLDRLDQPPILERHPAIAVYASLLHALGGRPEDSARWAEAAERSRYAGPMPDGSGSLEAWNALVRAARCTAGAPRMLADAEVALDTLAPESHWRTTGLIVLGAARLLSGDVDGADVAFTQAVDEARRRELPNGATMALAERSLIAAGKGRWNSANELAWLALEAAHEAGMGDAPHTALARAAGARAALRLGDWERAHRELAGAAHLLPQLSYGLPWFSVQVRLELARAGLALADAGSAEAALAGVDEILERRPGLGVLGAQAAELRAELVELRGQSGSPPASLTAAELRLLPYLPTHLTFRAIGERLSISRNTVKTEAISVYRKLGVSSRAEAILRAAELGLAVTGAAPPDPSPEHAPAAAGSSGQGVAGTRGPAARVTR